MRFPKLARVRETLIVVAGILALAGAVFAIFDLFRAIHQAEALYSVGMTGLSIEADLQDYTQESRRVFVYALTTTDPNIQLPYVNAARAADREVARLYGAFAEVQLNQPTRKQLNQLVADWNAYLSVRNEMIGFILEDHSDLALKKEQAQGAALFERCAGHLQMLKRLLDLYAKEQLTAVRQTYYRCAAEVGFLLVTTALMIASVRLLARLRKRNQKLTESELLERQRSEILESISANLQLETVLRAILRMVEQQLKSAHCAITTLRQGQIQLACAGTLPESATDALYGGKGDREGSDRENGHRKLTGALSTPSAQAVACGETVRTNLGGVEGIQSCWSVPILGSQRRVLGTVDVYFAGDLPTGTDDLRFVERAAQLGALAVEHRLVNEQLAFQAQHDSLTGLANRVMFQDRLDRAIARSTAETRGLAVLWIDLDRFKQVNDALGHQVGDALLRHVARRLENCIPADGTVARIGGDEFVILLPNCNHSSLAVNTAKKVLAKLNEPVTVSKHQITVGASIGIGLLPEHGTDGDTLLRNADTAMYSVKFQGKNMYQIYDPRMGTVSAETLELETQLRTALQRNEFEVHYQPQVNPDGRIECVEALLRWTSPALGSISPARFIPLAEDNGMIVPLGEWVLREACRQTAVWHHQGFRTLRIAVNVSAHQFVRPDFSDTVAFALQDSGLPPGCLELELTESAVMRNPEENLAQFQKLRRLGVRISIDDFGTGNSSLHYLLQLPVDALKIDRSFIDSLGRSGRDSLLLVRAIIGMAHGWRLQVIAEGIETQDQLHILQNEGCDLSQGFLLHRPMCAADLTALLPAQLPQMARLTELATNDLIAIGSLSGREPNRSFAAGM